MQIFRVKTLWLFCFTLIVLSIAATAFAQEYPTKPIRLIVPFTPGGGTDLIARTLSPGLSEALGQPVVVENRGGAGGVIGADIVAKAAPDGYVIFMGTPGPLTINPNLMSNIPYKLTDFAPVSLATISPFVLTVNLSVPAKSVKELINLAKAKPGTLNFGSAGNGSVAHLAGEQFKALAGIDITHVAYKSGGDALIALLSGEVQILIDNLPTVLPPIKEGKIRALAVGTKTKSELLLGYPSIREAGVPEYEQSTSSGILVPAKTPNNIIAKLNKAVVTVLRKQEIKDKFLTQGLAVVGSTPEEYAQKLQNELSQTAKVIKSAGIKLNP